MNYRTLITKAQNHKQFLEVDLVKKETYLKVFANELADHEHVRSVFKQSALLAQSNLSDHIAQIVTKSIEIVFPEKSLEFVVEFVERRNTTECDLYVSDGEHTYNLLEDRGHGMADIVSMALRVAFVSLAPVDNVIILDEPFRNLDVSKHELASQLIQSLSKELNMQFIICTHIKGLVAYADKNIHVNYNDGISTIEYK